MKRSLSIRAWGLGLAAWISLATAHAQDVLTQHNDNARTGANLHETHLNASNVNAQHFGKLFERSVDGSIYAQPLYASGVNTASHGVRNVIYVATMHDTVYAFDADDPHASSPLWTASLGPSVPLQDPNIGGGGGYNDISGEVGITSTPVISRAHNAIYVMTLTKIGNVYAHHLHALDLGSGQELFGGPRNIAATVPGTGGGSANGSVSLVNHLQNQRPALLLANDMVYMAFASFGDQGPYHGWVLGYSAAGLQPLPQAFNATPNGSLGGIWQAGQGPTADSDNNIYFITGNGTFGVDSIVGKVILPETAIGAPALANFGDQHLVVAWTGTDSDHHLNIDTSTDGRSFGNKVTLGDTSVDGPALAAGNGRLFFAWTGTDAQHHVNVMSSTDLHSFGNKVTLGETSFFGPALAFGNGRVFLAWTGTDSNHSLNVMYSTDGQNFTNKVTLGDNSLSAPGLAFIDGTLFLLWRGTDSNRSLNIMQSTDGVHFANKVTLGDSSDHASALVKHSGLWLTWTGRDAARSLNLMTGPQLSALGSKQTYSDTSIAAPALVDFRGETYLGWTGTDTPSHVNVAQLGGPPSLSDSFIKLAPGLALEDWFSPWNTNELSNTDEDLGSGGVLLLPNTQLLVGGGKEGKLYVLDRRRLGGFCSGCGNPAGDTQIVQWFQATGLPNAGTPPPPPAPYSNGLHHIHGSPVYWNSPNRGPLIYVWGEDDWLRAFHFNGTRLDALPADISAKLVTTPGASMPGAMLSISANASQAGTGIVWATHPLRDNANQQVVAGIVRALDASNLSRELWNSAQNPTRDNVGNCSKFAPPTVANGKVYVATFSNKLVVYGLLP